MILIKNGRFSIEEIINFMIKQDVYYSNPINKNNENRDPIIFSYIPITDEDKDYLNNIALIKKNRLWEMYNDSNNDLQEKFYQIILNQMKKIRDLNSIFEIFPIKSINKNFNYLTLYFFFKRKGKNRKIIHNESIWEHKRLINGKVNELMFTALDEKEDINKVLDNILDCNYQNDLDLKYIVELYQITYEFTSKYYFYLLKNKDLEYIVSKIKDFIVEFFIQQTREGKANAESLISLLLYSPNIKFSLYLLNQMDNMIVKEYEFYLKEDTPNFLLFKLFFEKCGELIQNKDVSQGKYLNESVLIKSKVLDDLKNNKIIYEVANNLIDENNSFYQKIFVVTDEKEVDANKLYDKIKQSVDICKKKFEKFTIIEEFYNTFYSNTKKKIINLIKEALNECKQKNINEIP